MRKLKVGQTTKISDHGDKLFRVHRVESDGTKIVRVLCSDRAILEKVEYSAHNVRPWKFCGTLKEGVTPDDWYRKKIDSGNWIDAEKELDENRKSRTGPSYGKESYFGVRVRRSEVESVLPSEYKGNTVYVKAGTDVTLMNLNWSGGTRSVYHFYNLSKGFHADGTPLSYPPPWRNPVEGMTVQIPSGCAVTEISCFCGKYSAHIVAHPDLFPKLLPSEGEMENVPIA